MNKEVGMEEKLKKVILDVPDFPKKGIIFKDLTPIFADTKVFSELVDHLAEKYKAEGITSIAGIESRGFIIGAPLAVKMGVPFFPVRKPGKLPRETYKEEYELEYGTDALEIHKDACGKGDKVLIIDDLLATGGTVRAVADLIKAQGAEIIGIAFIIELVDLKGRDKLKEYPIVSLVEFEGE